jgi:hypothetical protein
MNLRLVLPHDLVVSPNCMVSFMICLMPSTGSDVTPEFEVNWDNLQEGGTRRFARWTINDPKCKNLWLEQKLTLKAAPASGPSNQSAEGPQFISISAGKPKEKFTAYVAKFEIHDVPVAPRGEKAPPPGPETPVAPPRRSDAPHVDPAPPPSGNAPKKNPKTDPDSAIKDAL